jgi:hypothetical protein
MNVRFHSHAQDRMRERGTNEHEVSATVKNGERFPAKYGRTGFRRNFVYEQEWCGTYYHIKQVEVYAVQEGPDWLVITIIRRFF